MIRVVAGVVAQLALPLPARSAICEAAAATAEQDTALPSGLLAAISRIESGGRSAKAVTDQGWPWTVNSLGQGQRFPTKGEAITYARVLLLAGVRSIDVGCFQINLRWHPAAFASLEDAFDPATNARYAAAFLISLRGDELGWSGAIARYHSQSPSVGGPYEALVAEAWRQSAAGQAHRSMTFTTPELLIHVWYNAIVMPPGRSQRTSSGDRERRQYNASARSKTVPLTFLDKQFVDETRDRE